MTGRTIIFFPVLQIQRAVLRPIARHRLPCPAPRPVASSNARKYIPDDGRARRRRCFPGFLIRFFSRRQFGYFKNCPAAHSSTGHTVFRPGKRSTGKIHTQPSAGWQWIRTPSPWRRRPLLSSRFAVGCRTVDMQPTTVVVFHEVGTEARRGAGASRMAALPVLFRSAKLDGSWLPVELGQRQTPERLFSA